MVVVLPVTDKYALPNYYLNGREYSEPINGVILCSAFVEKVDALSGRDSGATMIDCRNVERYGLFLKHVNKFDTPIPVKGGMGIWYFDLEKMEKVNK